VFEQGCHARGLGGERGARRRGRPRGRLGRGRPVRSRAWT
jgi:hypothetical protein